MNKLSNYNRSIVIKLGGSFIRAGNKDLLSVIAEIINMMSQQYNIVVVTGGGQAANLVRYYDNNFSLSSKNAHFAAITAMEQNAYIFNDFLPSAHKLDKIKYLSVHTSCPNIFFPVKYYIDKDPLPYTWGITSDSIALDLSYKLNCSMLILLKNIDGIYSRDENGKIYIKEQSSISELAKTDIVDSFFCRFLKFYYNHNVDYWIINGNYPYRIKQLITSGQTKGSRILRG